MSDAALTLQDSSQSPFQPVEITFLVGYCLTYVDDIRAISRKNNVGYNVVVRLLF